MNAYVVQPGDNLLSIARKSYPECIGNRGKNVAYAERIYNANRNKIKTPGVVVPGMSLHIP